MLTKTAITLYCPLNDHDLRCVKNAEIDDRIVLSKVQAIINAGKHFEKFEKNSYESLLFKFSRQIYLVDNLPILIV